jgi:hypothetical protein
MNEKAGVKIGNEPHYAIKTSMLFFLDTGFAILFFLRVQQNCSTLIFVVIKAICWR